jgi:hypothetical protein
LVIDGHPDFDEPALAKSLCGEYLFANYQDRRFVVICLRDATSTYSRGTESREDAFMFAHQRTDATLSSLVFADGYNSNVVRSAVRSWRRMPNDLPL